MQSDWVWQLLRVSIFTTLKLVLLSVFYLTEVFSWALELLNVNNQEPRTMKHDKDEQRITMDFTKKELFVGAVEMVAKVLLGVITFIGLRLTDKVDENSNMNADVLNRVIEIKADMRNNQERIYNLERDFKQFQKDYYTRSRE